MSDDKHNIAVIDCETTGLDATEDWLLEVACIVIDQNYVELGRYEAVVFFSQSSVTNLKDASSVFVQEMHTKTGLWDRLNKPEAKRLPTINFEMTEFLRGFGKAKTMPIGGNSVALDQNFVREHLPSVYEFLDYHMRDVSTIAAFAQESFGVPWKAKKSDHTAMTDVEECIAELVYYRDAMASEMPMKNWRTGVKFGQRARVLEGGLQDALARAKRTSGFASDNVLREVRVIIEETIRLGEAMK